MKTYINQYPKDCPNNILLSDIKPEYITDRITVIGSAACRDCRHCISCTYNGDKVECNYPLLKHEIEPYMLPSDTLFSSIF